MEKENQRIVITKRLLKEALLRLLQRKKIGEITITELCREAGINRGTFYRHYGVPQDVLLEIEMELVEQAERIRPWPTSLQEIQSYLEKLFTLLYDNAELVRLLIRSSTEENLVHIFDLGIHAALEAKLMGTENTGIEKTGIKLLSAYVSSGGYYLVRTWLMEEVPMSPKELARLMFDLVTRDLESYIV